MSKYSVMEEEFEVGDIILLGFGDCSESYVITNCMPLNDPSYYMCINSNGSIATIWKGSITRKLDHVDLKGLFEKLKMYKEGGDQNDNG